MPIQQQTGFAEVNGTRLYYEIAGSGDPLLLIHGSTLDTRMWDDQFETFAQHYTVVRYDVRGFGKSALPAGESYARPDDLKGLLDYLDIAHASVLGLSMGGGIAIDFVLAYPAGHRRPDTCGFDSRWLATGSRVCCVAERSPCAGQRGERTGSAGRLALQPSLQSGAGKPRCGSPLGPDHF